MHVCMHTYNFILALDSVQECIHQKEIISNNFYESLCLCDLIAWIILKIIDNSIVVGDKQMIN